MTEEFDERRQALERVYASKQEDLSRSFEEEKTRLTNEERRLLEREKELDDRNNTHARRAIRGELIEAVKIRQQNFDVSKDIRWLRVPIHAIFLLLVFGTFAGAATSLTALSNSNGIKDVNIGSLSPYFIVVLLKSLLFTASFLTSAGLYISWMNKWFDKHAEAQFHTKQFEFDINRASWAVEAALEWKTSQNEEMPDALLKGITRNLFDARPNDSITYAPVDALASSILGSASNLKLNVGGSEMSFDRKGIKEISKKEGIS